MGYIYFFKKICKPFFVINISDKRFFNKELYVKSRSHIFVEVLGRILRFLKIKNWNYYMDSLFDYCCSISSPKNIKIIHAQAGYALKTFQKFKGKDVYLISDHFSQLATTTKNNFLLYTKEEVLNIKI